MKKLFKFDSRLVRWMFLFLLIACLHGAASAATFVVTKTADTNDGVCDADCSLREAINAANVANTDDIITFDAAVFSTPQTITLNGTELINGNAVVSSGNLSINGRGAGLLTISGNNASRVFYNRNSTLSMSQLIITGGNGVSSLNSGLGGGIYNEGSLNLFGLVITGNTVNLGGGGIYSAAAATGMLNIVESRISGNTARNGGGIYYSSPNGSGTISNTNIDSNSAEGGGGGIFVSTGTINMTDSNITNNNSSGGGGIYNIGGGTMTIITTNIIANRAAGTGGGIYNANTMDLRYSTVIGNTANPLGFTEGGGGIYNQGTLNMLGTDVRTNTALNSTFGGGLLNRGTANITISTIGGNTAASGGGIVNYEGVVNLDSSTVAKNMASGNGGGIFNLANGVVKVKNTIIANNTANAGADFSGALVTLGFNLIQNITNFTGMFAPTDITGQDPLFLPPNYGSSPQTFALSAASPAIDKGVRPTGLNTDQRGAPRPYDNPLIANAAGGDGSDIGAFERQAVEISIRTPFDFEGDGRADLSVFRPSNGTWYLNRSTQLAGGAPSSGFDSPQFGKSGDTIVPADYDGDGKTDIAVYRAGTWYLQRSTAGFAGIQFGLATDVPMPADFDGDGKADLAVYRPSNGTWYVLNLTNNAFNAVQFGISIDKPVAADYDGDGKADYAVYRPDNGVWYLLQSTKGFAAIQFGISTDKPVVGDYDGDGKADQAVYRASIGTWYMLNSTTGFAAAQFGVAEDKPTPADYDGDGKTDISVFRPSNGTWYELRSTSGFFAQQFGVSEDLPAPNAFVR